MSEFKAATGQLVHWELTVPDIQKGKAFYGELFAWKIHDDPEGKESWVEPAAEGAPCGSMLRGKPAENDATRLVFFAQDIPETLARARRLGARIEKERTELPGGHGFHGEFRDPFGNLVGLYSTR